MKRLDVFNGVVVGSLLFLMVGCASQLRMTRSAAVPAAVGVVDVKTTDNGNTAIELKVEHLAPPDRVDPNAKNYMVWARGMGAGDVAQAMGALLVDDKLKGTIKFVTPMREFDLLVTPEASSEVSSPSGNAVLSTRVRVR